MLIFPPSHPTLIALNQLISVMKVTLNNEQLNEHNVGKNISDPSKDSLNPYRAVQSNVRNITLLSHSTKLPGYTI